MEYWAFTSRSDDQKMPAIFQRSMRKKFAYRLAMAHRIEEEIVTMTENLSYCTGGGLGDLEDWFDHRYD